MCSKERNRYSTDVNRRHVIFYGVNIHNGSGWGVHQYREPVSGHIGSSQNIFWEIYNQIHSLQKNTVMLKNVQIRPLCLLIGYYELLKAFRDLHYTMGCFLTSGHEMISSCWHQMDDAMLLQQCSIELKTACVYTYRWLIYPENVTID